MNWIQMGRLRPDDWMFSLKDRPKTSTLPIRTVDDASAPNHLASLVSAVRYFRVEGRGRPSAVDYLTIAITQLHGLTAGKGSTELTDKIDKCCDDGESLRPFIKKHEDHINAMDGLGRTPLTLAVENGASKELVETLIKYDASVDQADARGYTPLAIAARSGNLVLIDVLILSGASSRVPGWAPRGTLSPLAQAMQKPLGYGRVTKEKMVQAQRARERVIKALWAALLAEGKVLVDQENPTGRPSFVQAQIAEALLHAAENTCVEAVEFLLEVNGTSLSEDCIEAALVKVCGSPAVGSRAFEIVQLLFEKLEIPARPRIIRLAIESGKTAVVKFLLAHSKHASWIRADVYLTMHAAIENGRTMFALVWPYVERSLSLLNEQDLARALVLAAERGRIQAVQALVGFRHVGANSASWVAAAAIEGGDQAVFELIWPDVAPNLQGSDKQQILFDTAVKVRNRFAAKALLEAGERLCVPGQVIPLLSVALSSGDSTLLTLVQRRIRNFEYGQKIELMNAVVRDKDEDKAALRLAIDTVFETPVNVQYGHGAAVMELLNDRSQIEREIMRYLLLRPLCAPAFAYAADRESNDSSIPWLSIVTSYFDVELDRDWIAKTAAKALSSAETVGGISLLLDCGAALHMDKRAAFAALRCACNKGGFELVPVLLNSDAGLTLSDHECRELWELAMRRIVDHARENPSARPLNTKPLDELRRRANVEEALT